MTIKNKKQVSEYFRRKLGRDPFSSREIKSAKTFSRGLRTNKLRKQLRRGLM